MDKPKRIRKSFADRLAALDAKRGKLAAKLSFLDSARSAMIEAERRKIEELKSALESA